MLHALNARARDDREAGFTLIEILVAMVLMAIVMSSLAVFFIGAQKSTAAQRMRQDAAVLADQAMDQVHSVAVGSLLTGRDLTTSTAEWAAPVTGVDLSTMAPTPLYDPAAATGAGATAAIPTTPKIYTVNGTPFSVSWYIGKCYLPRGGGACTPTAPADPITMDRVIAAVNWTVRGSSCPNSICAYVVASLISPVGDPTFNVNQVLIDTTPPTTPTNLTCTTATDTSIASISWNASSDASGVASYSISRGTNTTFSTWAPPIASQTSNAAYTDTGLVPSTTYYYVVTATDTAGNVSSVQVPPGTVTNPQAPFMVSCTTKPDTTPPTAPVLVAGTPPSTMISTTINWSGASDDYKVGGYQIFRNGTYIAQVAAGVSTYTDSASLLPWTTYTYTVKTIDPAGNLSPASNSVAIKTLDTSAPTAPTGLTAVNPSSAPTEIDLDWADSTDNVGVTSYQVYRSTPTAGTMSLLTTTTVSNYANTGLASNTKYYYTVYALDAAGNKSTVSNTASASTPDSIPPTAPTSLTAPSKTATSVTLSWSGATDNIGVVGYYVYRNGGTTPIVSTTATTFTDTGLLSYTAYTYAVKAYDAAGNVSPASTSLNVTTLDGTPPSTPVLSSGGYTYTTATISWTTATDNVGVTGYAIYRNGGTTAIATTTNAVFTYTDTGLLPGTANTYTVKAFDAAANLSTASNTVTVTTTTDSSPPSVITGLHGVSGGSGSKTVVLTWNAASDNVGVVGYKVYFGGSLQTTVPSTTATVSGLAVSTAYSITVYAYDASGNVATSSPVDTCTVTNTGNVSCTS